MKVYAAYGSNLNHQQMAGRCPKARFIESAILKNHQLVFRRVADIEYSKGAEVQLGLWLITDECLKALDRYEGYPYMYEREMFHVETEAQQTQAIIYFMNSAGYASPSIEYYESIVEGYRDCGLPVTKLHEASRVTHDLWEQENEEFLGFVPRK